MPTEPRSAPLTADNRRLADKLGEKSRQRPPIWQGRGLATILVGVVALGVAVSQLFGFTKSGPAERLRKDIESRAVQPRAREGSKPANPAPPTPVEPPAPSVEASRPPTPAERTPPAAPTVVESIPPGVEAPATFAAEEPLPSGLDAMFETHLRVHVAAVRDRDQLLTVRADSLRSLPAFVATAPESMRRAVRGYALRSIAPFTADESPLTALAIESAAWIVRDDPQADPEIARRILREGALRRLRAGEARPVDLSSSVGFARQATGAERPEAQRALKSVVLDATFPAAIRASAAAALDASEIDGLIRALAADPGTNPVLKDAINSRTLK